MDSKSGGQKICYPEYRTIKNAIRFPRFIAAGNFYFRDNSSG
ncbi:hypothetical protein SKA58_13922 [Sphingomonas sp. SKA58]|nr:hypothetical protein SKA58_13922 [Sphingomonas sp. SKA58]